MKIHSVTTNTGYLKGKAPERLKGRESFYEHKNNIQKNNDQINTTIKSNSDGRVSFKGNVPLLHRMANFTSDNPLVAEALFAILITCGLRPLSIMATAKTEEDKEKCTYQAAKSVSSGLVGLATTALVGTPIAAASKAANKRGAFKMPAEMKEKSTQAVKKGVAALTELGEKLTQSGKNPALAEQIKNLTENGNINLNVLQKSGKNAVKQFQNSIDSAAPEISDTVKTALKEQKVINNYARTGKNVIDKMFQPVFLPIRASVTIALVPVIIGLLGIKKSSAKPKEAEQNPYNACRLCLTSNEKELFNSFSGVANHENK